MSKATYPIILFDLDGTLTDPYEGIVGCFRYTFAQLGYPEPSEAELRAAIGPPLYETFLHSLGSAAQADEAVRIYRSRYEPIGAFENRVYAGIPELLTQLRDAGCRLAIATSKLDDVAEVIVKHFGLWEYFELLVGSSRDNNFSAKADIIRVALERLKPGDQAVVMIGDRKHDVIGAQANGIPCIGAAYGYGSSEELYNAGAIAVAATVAELQRLLLEQ